MCQTWTSKSMACKSCVCWWSTGHSLYAMFSWALDFVSAFPLRGHASKLFSNPDHLLLYIVPNKNPSFHAMN